VAVDGDREDLLGPLLPDDVLVEDFLDLARGGDLRDRLGDLPLLVFGEDLVAEGDALVADVDRGTGDELPDGVLRLAADACLEPWVTAPLWLV